jgi:hypothetical protein
MTIRDAPAVARGEAISRIGGPAAKISVLLTACRRAGLVLILVSGTFAASCHKVSGDDPFPSPQPGKCEGVWSSTYDQCLIDSQCIGLACLSAMQYCSSQANQQLAVCCGTNFPIPPIDKSAWIRSAIHPDCFKTPCGPAPDTSPRLHLGNRVIDGRTLT